MRDSSRDLREPRRRPRGTGLVALCAAGALVAGCGPVSTGLDAAADRAGAPDDRSITIVGGGDLLIHPPVWEQARDDGGGAFDFRPMFDGIAPSLTGADLALCHLEVPLAGPKGPFSGWPTFKAPPQLLDGVERAGYDGCSTASNHVLDYGEQGVRRTLAAFDRAGLGAAGSARSAAEAASPQTYRVRPESGAPVEVAHLSSTATLNGMERPPGKKWLANLADPKAIRAEARAAKEAGAEIVVLSMHWGTEYDHGVDERQRELADALIGSPDIDVILGHHAHVVQPVEKADGKWIVYGMGNQLARHAAPVDANREGAMARVTFTETAPGKWRTEQMEILPTWVDIEPKVRLVDLATALRDPRTPPERRAVYAAAHARITEYVDGRGALDDGMTVAPAH